jgi:hypothetical protein
MAETAAVVLGTSAEEDMDGADNVTEVNALDALRHRDIHEALVALWSEILVAEYRGSAH